MMDAPMASPAPATTSPKAAEAASQTSAPDGDRAARTAWELALWVLALGVALQLASDLYLGFRM